MPEHKGEWEELEAMAQAAIESPVPKSQIPSRRLALAMLASRRKRRNGARPTHQKKKHNFRRPRKSS
jgi:hypothetical protein